MPDSRPVFTIGAFAIIFNAAGDVLLSHRRDMDAWNLPGGGMEPGELPDECVVREVLEETGLCVTPSRLVGVYGKPNRNEIVFSFVCHVESGELIETSESDQSAYFSPQALPANVLLKHAERIWDAIDGQSTPRFRRQYMRPKS